MLSRDHARVVRVEGAKVDAKLQHTVAPLSWLEGLRSPTRRLPTGFFVEKPIHVSESLNVSDASASASPNGVQAGPLVLYISGQTSPVVVDVAFVPDELLKARGDDCDLRVGIDAVSQCTLFNELRPGGLLSDVPISELKKYGMKTTLANSPLVARPWTRMKHMFIDEIQRGPKLQEFVGYNARVGNPWRFSQHTKYFRVGIWRESIRRGDLHEGPHNHS
eukprot:GILJ01032320.1.p1 GENE.GILJ01032320.1~~GILJ01032320.1.p1  ORF type:complete len:238 (-),score=7.97 GILJ01032320.1:15-674(-)